MPKKLFSGLAVASVFVAAIPGVRELSRSSDGANPARPKIALSQLAWVKDVKRPAGSPETNSSMSGPVDGTACKRNDCSI